MVSFKNGKPDKNNYRRFKIKTVKGIDDPAMIKEVVYRRYKRLKEEKRDFPDLILIDGGKGQLSSAKAALDSLDLKISIISLAKRLEEIYLTDKPEPIKLPIDSGALHLLQSIRDESHRAAVGKLARDEIEYLMSRGLDEDEATATIIRGFLDVKIAGLPEALQRQIDSSIDVAEKAGF